ncbi:MAG: phenylalanine--tRNA ligase subunit beta [Deltaproteobacteria bacterium]|nr:phenylalanine--tRNA ligase subunit beta [Deltaproteobacteria bacterium]
MRVSLNWLKDYVNIDISPHDLAERLTMTGLEVETLDPVGHSLQDIVTAKILSVTRHPDADRLFLCRVDAGDGEVPVVCGATNLEEGILVPMALPGTELPGGLKVKESRIRGERSAGMLLAEDEMRLTDDHKGLMILPSDLNPGDRVSHALALEDWALDVAITPNRPDCASVIGIAREIAAITGQKLKRPQIKVTASSTPIEDLTQVTVDDPLGCPRYAAGIIRGVELRPSPFWLRYRLHISGVRAINNIVDVTNYVLLETGHPLHSFDYDRLRGNRIVVRRAEDNEVFTTLDGQSHSLNAEMLMICDAERAVAVAGIMGGLNSEIFSGSTNVLVESAFFDPVTIRRGAKRLGMSTEASYRFERGVDIEGVPIALERALMLMHQLGGGEVAKGFIDEYPKPFIPSVISLRIEKANSLLGSSISCERAMEHLKALEMEVEKLGADILQVTPPSFRVDLIREVDLVEEVARMEGFDEISVTYPSIKSSDEVEPPEQVMAETLRETMVGLGFNEVINYSFVSPNTAELLMAGEESPLRSFVPILNPLTVDQSVMRTSLVPGTLETIRTNVAYGMKDLRLFEWGNVFIHTEADTLPHEKPFLVAVMTGLFNQKQWYCEERNVDFFDIKGIVEVLLRTLGFRDTLFKRGEMPPYYNPEISSRVYLSDHAVGNVGQVLPKLMADLDLETLTAYLFELDISALLERTPKPVAFKPLPKFPAVFRDLSLIVQRQVESGKIQEIVKREGGDLLESVHLYDLYEGGKIDRAEKAVTLRICYRSREGTLEGKDINRLHETIIERIGREIGARLRET